MDEYFTFCSALTRTALSGYIIVILVSLGVILYIKLYVSDATIFLSYMYLFSLFMCC